MQLENDAIKIQMECKKLEDFVDEKKKEIQDLSAEIEKIKSERDKEKKKAEELKTEIAEAN